MNTTWPCAHSAQRFFVVNAHGQVVWVGHAPNAAAAVRCARAGPFRPEHPDACPPDTSTALRVFACDIDLSKPRAMRLALAGHNFIGTMA